MRELERQEQYEGTVVQVGNSRGMRPTAGFFLAHPEFDGTVKVTLVADGFILVSAKPVARRRAKGDAADPFVASFLQFIQRQMTERPEDIVTADAGQLRRIGKLPAWQDLRHGLYQLAAGSERYA